MGLREVDQAPSHETGARAGRAWPIPTIYRDWVKALTGAADTSDEEVLAKVEPSRARVERLRDPFLAIARGDPAALKKEKVLWRDEQFLVISDTFASGAKTLVIPARSVALLVDLSAAERSRLEEITGAVVEAFRQVTGKESRAWVNVPGGLSVKQLHVHVQPSHGDKSAEDEVAAWLAKNLSQPPFSQPQEVEIKLGLEGEDALDKLKAALGGEADPTVTQTNHFFDTAARALDEARCTVRVREETGARGTEWTLTLKGVEQVDGELSQKAESEWVLDEDVAKALLGREGEDPLAKARALDDGSGAGLLAHLEGLAAGEALKEIGSFTNERTRVRVKLDIEGAAKDAVFELDKTTFPGDQVACELELEVPEDEADAWRAAVTTLVDKAGLKTHKSKSKAARFFKALRELNG